MKIPTLTAFQYTIMLCCQECPRKYVDIIRWFAERFEESDISLKVLDQLVKDRWLWFEPEEKEYILTEAGLRECNRTRIFYDRIR